MKEDMKEVDRTVLSAMLQREPTETELRQYSDILDRNAVKLKDAYSKYIKTIYRGESVTGMVWAEVDYKYNVISCGAEQEIQKDPELLFPAITAAVNEANKKSTAAYKKYQTEYMVLSQDLVKEIQGMIDMSVNKIDSKLLN